MWRESFPARDVNERNGDVSPIDDSFRFADQD